MDMSTISGTAALLSSINLLAIIGVGYKLGQYVQRIRTLERQGNQQVPVAALSVKMDNVSKQLDELTRDFKEFQHQVMAGGHVSAARAGGD